MSKLTRSIGLSNAYKDCQSKTVSVSVSPHSRYPMTQEVATATLQCPKTILSGESLAASAEGYMGYTGLTEQNSVNTLRSLANSAICQGCPFVDMPPQAAYDTARQTMQSRIDAINTQAELSALQPDGEWPQLPPGLYNPRELQ